LYKNAGVRPLYVLCRAKARYWSKVRGVLPRQSRLGPDGASTMRLKSLATSMKYLNSVSDLEPGEIRTFLPSFRRTFEFLPSVELRCLSIFLLAFGCRLAGGHPTVHSAAAAQPHRQPKLEFGFYGAAGILGCLTVIYEIFALLYPR